VAGGCCAGVQPRKDGFGVDGQFRTPWRVVLWAEAERESTAIVRGAGTRADPALLGRGEWRLRAKRMELVEGRPEYMTSRAEKMIDTRRGGSSSSRRGSWDGCSGRTRGMRKSVCDWADNGVSGYLEELQRAESEGGR
jgi:hypothetical protein